MLLPQALYQENLDLTATLSKEAFEATLARYPIGELRCGATLLLAATRQL